MEPQEYVDDANNICVIYSQINYELFTLI